MSEREVVRCRCGLNQFVPASLKCVKCGAGVVPPPRMKIVPATLKGTPFLHEALRITLRANRGGRSKKRQAQIMKCRRQYVYDIENGRYLPGLAQLDRFAVSFGLPLSELLWEIECLAKVLEGGSA